MKKEDNDEDGLPLLPLILGDPRVLQLIKNGELLRRKGYLKGKHLLEPGSNPDDLSIPLLAGFAKLATRAESGLGSMDAVLKSLQTLDLSKPLTNESYGLLKAAIEAMLIMALQAAIEEESGVVKMVYTLLFFDLYTLKYKLSDIEYKQALSSKSIGEKILDAGSRGLFFAVFKELIDVMSEYFRSGEAESDVDFIIDWLEALYEKYL